MTKEVVVFLACEQPVYFAFGCGTDQKQRIGNVAFASGIGRAACHLISDDQGGGTAAIEIDRMPGAKLQQDIGHFTVTHANAGGLPAIHRAQVYCGCVAVYGNKCARAAGYGIRLASRP